MKDMKMRVDVSFDGIEKYAEVDCRNVTCKYHMADSTRCGLKSISIGRFGLCENREQIETCGQTTGRAD